MLPPSLVSVGDTRYILIIVGTIISPGDVKVVRIFGVKSGMFFPS